MHVGRENLSSGALEAMQWLPEGKHRLRIEGGKSLRLNIRAIPELMYCYYPPKPYIEAFGPYDWVL